MLKTSMTQTQLTKIMKFHTSPATPGELTIDTPTTRIVWRETMLATEVAQEVFSSGWAKLLNWVHGNIEEAVKNGSAVSVQVHPFDGSPSQEGLFSSRHAASEWLNKTLA